MSATPSPLRRLAILLRLAGRDLRGGLRGYGIFLACIALGVAAIAGVGSVAGGLKAGLAREGATILGGDAAFAVMNVPLAPGPAAALAALGRTSTVATLRAMARAGDGAPGLVDLKAVDAAYPLLGAVALDPPSSLGDALALKDGRYGLVADAELPARIGATLGDLVTIGTATFQLRALLRREPDRLAGGIALGPRVIVSDAALNTTGLLQPGSLARWSTRVVLPGQNGQPASDAALDRVVQDAKARFPEAGWDIRTRKAVSPEFDRNLERFTQFLTLVGLTALIVGGVGVANAVQATVERKRASLAVLKALGATGGTVFAVSLLAVLAVALLGVAIGLGIGAAMPFGVVAAFGALIPFPLVATLVPSALGLGALYGVLTALAFSLGALGRAHDIPVSALFRDTVEPGQYRLRLRYRVAVAAALLALVGVTVGFAADHRLALLYVGATLAAFALLRGVAFALTRLARAAPHAGWLPLRLAVANLHRPGALTPAVVLSLGLGLTLLVTLALIDTNIRDQLSHTDPAKTPSFFFIDIPSAQQPAFDSFLRTEAPDAVIQEVPMMRGRITALNGVPVEKVKATGDAAWVLEGDRGITFQDAPPDGSTVVAGQWWPRDYAGPPLVSFDRKLADGLGLHLGDSVSVNVLGRVVTARIANLRSVDWESFGINFVMVFSSNTFRGAPHMVLATAGFPHGSDPTRELALLKAVATAFPTVTAVRVKDALDAVSALVGRLALAIRGASSIAIAASVLVLAGAVAAGRRTRVYEAVVLKVLGATRGRLLATYLIEYGLLGAATALFGVAAGTGAAWFIVGRVMHMEFRFAWGAAFGAASLALLVTVALGLAGTWRILGQKPAATLRAR
ncbi:FtsX-like permease family protein [Lichenihabitans sp. Uapishka_5]|uniref:ABC transporter permease n=1 Tax=Lichenihabitans sp. Uapishka_5 TaxID=3037302 RepID=UPI0029E828CD|nr:FtsX-like permease family protein [Lichenihabitans sp. Uapishka_5]MDX7951424.1 FtsX-like permease family protein [Lichenihabitans sp. Uapishka_5]